MTDQDWLKTKVYSFRELLEILINCKTKEEIKELSDYIMSYKRKYCLADLDKLKTLISIEYKMKD